MSEFKKEILGSGWASKTYPDTYINFKVNPERLNHLPKDSYGNVSLTMIKSKQPSEKTKATHYITFNDYVPGQKTQVKLPTKEQLTPKQQQTDFLDPEDIPFE